MNREIIEGNEIIAEFIGAKKWNGYVWYYEGRDGFQSTEGKFLIYHSSWDWLMPVVEKIRIQYENSGLYGAGKKCLTLVLWQQ